MPETSVYVGIKNGKPIHKHVRASSQKELDKKVRKLKSEIEENQNVIDNAIFSVWADKWYQTKVNSGIKHATLVEYKAALNRLNEYFGNQSMRYITLNDFQQMIDDVANRNPNTNMPGSKKLLNDLRSVARNVFRLAIANRISGITDFFGSVIIPKTAPVKKRESLTEQQIEWVVNTPHRAQLPFMIMTFGGLRRGETIPLEWSDIDLKNGTIRVTKFVSFEDNNPVVSDIGKSDSARRIVKIPPVLVDFIKKAKQESDPTTELVTTKVSGGLHTASSWNKMTNSYLLDLNVKYGFEGRDVSKFDPQKLPFVIKGFTGHWGRHTYATLLYLSKVDVVTAKQLIGHNDIRVTVNTYTDLEKNSFLTISDDFKKKLEHEYKIEI